MLVILPWILKYYWFRIEEEDAYDAREHRTLQIFYHVFFSHDQKESPSYVVAWVHGDAPRKSFRPNTRVE
ncbi:hypothetical protein [Phocaeicola plebeius]